MRTEPVARRWRGGEEGGGQAGYSAGSGAAAVFVPPIAGYAVLLDSTDPLSIVNSSGKCSSWTNKGILGGTVSNSTPANQPVITAGGLGGKTTLTFNGTSTTLNGTQILSPANRGTMFVVGKNAQTGAVQNTIVSFGLSVPELTIYRNATDAVAMWDNVELAFSTWGTTNPHAVGCVFNGGSSSLYLDSTTPSASGNAGSNFPDAGLTVGSQQGGPFWNGLISCFLAYSAVLAPTDVGTTMAALKAYYGTP